MPSVNEGRLAVAIINVLLGESFFLFPACGEEKYIRKKWFVRALSESREDWKAAEAQATPEEIEEIDRYRDLAEQEISMAGEFAKAIDLYYHTRQLKRPSLHEALLWTQTELGEATDEAMLFDYEWVRNNEQPAPSKDRLGKELGDVILMAQVAGMVAGVNPIACLLQKMRKKLKMEMRELIDSPDVE